MCVWNWKYWYYGNNQSAFCQSCCGFEASFTIPDGPARETLASLLSSCFLLKRSVTHGFLMKVGKFILRYMIAQHKQSTAPEQILFLGSIDAETGACVSSSVNISLFINLSSDACFLQNKV